MLVHAPSGRRSLEDYLRHAVPGTAQTKVIHSMLELREALRQEQVHQKAALNKIAVGRRIYSLARQRMPTKDANAHADAAPAEAQEGEGEVQPERPAKAGRVQHLMVALQAVRSSARRVIMEQKITAGFKAVVSHRKAKRLLRGIRHKLGVSTQEAVRAHEWDRFKQHLMVIKESVNLLEEHAGRETVQKFQEGVKVALACCEKQSYARVAFLEACRTLEMMQLREHGMADLKVEALWQELLAAVAIIDDYEENANELRQVVAELGRGCLEDSDDEGLETDDEADAAEEGEAAGAAQGGASRKDSVVSLLRGSKDGPPRRRSSAAVLLHGQVSRGFGLPLAPIKSMHDAEVESELEEAVEAARDQPDAGRSPVRSLGASDIGRSPLSPPSATKASASSSGAAGGQADAAKAARAAFAPLDAARAASAVPSPTSSVEAAGAARRRAASRAGSAAFSEGGRPKSRQERAAERAESRESAAEMSLAIPEDQAREMRESLRAAKSGEPSEALAEALQAEVEKMGAGKAEAVHVVRQLRREVWQVQCDEAVDALVGESCAELDLLKTTIVSIRGQIESWSRRSRDSPASAQEDPAAAWQRLQSELPAAPLEAPLEEGEAEDPLMSRQGSRVRLDLAEDRLQELRASLQLQGAQDGTPGGCASGPSAGPSAPGGGLAVPHLGPLALPRLSAPVLCSGQPAGAGAPSETADAAGSPTARSSGGGSEGDDGSQHLSPRRADTVGRMERFSLPASKTFEWASTPSTAENEDMQVLQDAIGHLRSTLCGIPGAAELLAACAASAGELPSFSPAPSDGALDGGSDAGLGAGSPVSSAGRSPRGAQQAARAPSGAAGSPAAGAPALEAARAPSGAAGSPAAGAPAAGPPAPGPGQLRADGAAAAEDASPAPAAPAEGAARGPGAVGRAAGWAPAPMPTPTPQVVRRQSVPRLADLGLTVDMRPRPPPAAAAESVRPSATDDPSRPARLKAEAAAAQPVQSRRSARGEADLQVQVGNGASHGRSGEESDRVGRVFSDKLKFNQTKGVPAWSRATELLTAAPGGGGPAARPAGPTALAVDATPSSGPQAWAPPGTPSTPSAAPAAAPVATAPQVHPTPHAPEPCPPWALGDRRAAPPPAAAASAAGAHAVEAAVGTSPLAQGRPGGGEGGGGGGGSPAARTQHSRPAAAEEGAGGPAAAERGGAPRSARAPVPGGGGSGSGSPRQRWPDQPRSAGAALAAAPGAPSGRVRAGLWDLRRRVVLRWGDMERAASALCGRGGEVGGSTRVAVAALHCELREGGYRPGCPELCVLLRALGLPCTETATISRAEFLRLEAFECELADSPRAAALPALDELLGALELRRMLVGGISGPEQLLSEVFLAAERAEREGAFEVGTPRGKPARDAVREAAEALLLEALGQCAEALKGGGVLAGFADEVVSTRGLSIFAGVLTSGRLGPAPRKAAAAVVGGALEQVLAGRSARAEGGGGAADRAPAEDLRLEALLAVELWLPLLRFLDPEGDVPSDAAAHGTLVPLLRLARVPAMVAGPSGEAIAGEVAAALQQLAAPRPARAGAVARALATLETLAERHAALDTSAGGGTAQEVHALCAALGGCGALRGQLEALDDAEEDCLGDLPAGGSGAARAGGARLPPAVRRRAEALLSAWGAERRRLVARWQARAPQAPTASPRQWARSGLWKLEALSKVESKAHAEGFDLTWAPPAPRAEPPPPPEALARADPLGALLPGSVEYELVLRLQARDKALASFADGPGRPPGQPPQGLPRRRKRELSPLTARSARGGLPPAGAELVWSVHGPPMSARLCHHPEAPGASALRAVPRQPRPRKVLWASA